MARLRDRLWQGLAELPGVELNGHAAQRAPGILSITIDDVEGESLLFALPDLAVASGSACATASAEPSYVLRALGRSDRLAQSSLRLSLGRYTTAGEIELAIAAIQGAIRRLRAVAPREVAS
jgi:cysteine desulfurase